MRKFIIEIRTKGFKQDKKGFEDIKNYSDKATEAKKVCVGRLGHYEIIYY